MINLKYPEKIKCRQCEETKLQSEFYWNKSGYLHRRLCKQCTQQDSKQYYQLNTEKVLQRTKQNYKQWYEKNKERKSEYAHCQWLKLKGQPVSLQKRKYLKLWRQKYPERAKASQILRQAIKKGLIKKPEYCSLCGEKKRLHGHHKDYNRPLDVIWCCTKCHKKEERRKKYLLELPLFYRG